MPTQEWTRLHEQCAYGITDSLSASVASLRPAYCPVASLLAYDQRGSPWTVRTDNGKDRQ